MQAVCASVSSFVLQMEMLFQMLSVLHVTSGFLYFHSDFCFVFLFVFLLYDSSGSQAGLVPERFYQEGLWTADFKRNINNKNAII